MPSTTPQTPDEYIASLPEGRRTAVDYAEARGSSRLTRRAGAG